MSPPISSSDPSVSRSSARMSSRAFGLWRSFAKGHVEGHYFPDTASSAACQVAKVSRPKGGILIMELAGKGHVRLFQRPNLHPRSD